TPTTLMPTLFFFQAEDGIRDRNVTGVQTCALPISERIVVQLWKGILKAFLPLKVNFIQAMRQLIFITTIKKILNCLLKWVLKHLEYPSLGLGFSQMAMMKCQMKQVFNFTTIYLMNFISII